jgi:hypothetical protein
MHFEDQISVTINYGVPIIFYLLGGHVWLILGGSVVSSDVKPVYRDN